MDSNRAKDPNEKSSPITVFFAWLAVGLPLFWGVEQTLEKTLALLR
jgi:hypothetical protein